MTNEEKAREILNCENCKKQLIVGGIKCPPECTNHKDLMEMAEWKEQEIIKKAWDWFDEHFDVNIYEEIGGRKAAEILTYDFKSFASMFEDFKQAMKGE